MKSTICQDAMSHRLAHNDAGGEPTRFLRTGSLALLAAVLLLTAMFISPDTAEAQSSPDPQVVLTTAADEASCPQTFAAAQALDEAPSETISGFTGSTVTFCLNAANLGDADVPRVSVRLDREVGPPLYWAAVAGGSTSSVFPVGAEFADSYDLEMTTLPYTVTLSLDDRNEALAADTIVVAALPDPQVVLTTAADKASCPQTFAAAQSLDQGPSEAISGVVGSTVTFCLNAANLGEADVPVATVRLDRSVGPPLYWPAVAGGSTSALFPAGAEFADSYGLVVEGTPYTVTLSLDYRNEALAADTIVFTDPTPTEIVHLRNRRSGDFLIDDQGQLTSTNPLIPGSAWVLRYLPNGNVHIVNQTTDDFLDADITRRGRVLIGVEDAAETGSEWTLVERSDGRFYIENTDYSGRLAMSRTGRVFSTRSTATFAQWQILPPA